MLHVPFFFFGLQRGRSPASWPHFQHLGNPSTTRGRRQCLTGRTRHTPLCQEVSSARTKIAWEWNPYTSSVCYNDCQRNDTMHTRPVITSRPNKGVPNSHIRKGKKTKPPKHVPFFT